MKIDLKINKRIFNDVYYPLLFDYEKRYKVLYGGAGSGKSVFVAQKLIIKALNEKRRILCMRKVGTTVKQSIFQLLLDQLEQFNLLPYCTINKTDFTITLVNGSVFLCTGLDNSEKLKSIAAVTDIWLEEATEFTYEDFSQVDLRLRNRTALNQEIIFTFNPIAKTNWCYKLFFDEDFETDEAAEQMKGFRAKCDILKTTYKDNRFLPQSYIDSLIQMQAINPTYYRIYALGDFCSLDRLVFNNWQVGAVPSNTKELQLLIGMDFGYINDASTLIVSYLDEANKVIYIADELYKKGALNDELAAEIKYKGYAKEVIIADSAEQKSIEEIKRLGVSRIRAATKGKGSVLQGIQKLQQYKLIVSPNCENTIIELENYAWKKDKSTNEYTNQPIDSYNHCLDALRYSLQCVENKNKLKTLNKANFGL